MVTFDCPWCNEPAMTETVDAQAVTCDACGVRVDLAPDPIGDLVARAA
jgi:transcription elongation factor Elf1